MSLRVLRLHYPALLLMRATCPSAGAAANMDKAATATIWLRIVASPAVNRHVITVSMAARESDNAGARIALSGAAVVGDAVAATRRFANGEALPADDAARLCVIVEELVTNLLEHGASRAPIGLALERSATAVRIVIDDGCQPFDPRSADDATVVPARGGGAGLRLVRAWAEILGYDRVAGRNRLELLFPLAG